MRVLAVGDVCSEVGCNMALKFIPKLRKEHNIDVVIVNGENSAIGNGITPESADILFAAGADVITGGNHSLRRREVHSMLDENSFLLRPHNMNSDYGSGYCLLDLGYTTVAVINLSGQIYLDLLKASNPFLAADELIECAKIEGAKYIFVDFHAEATSEKRALGYYLDGRVSAVFGTHTHVQTSDAQILPKGTAYITDIGMTGVDHSVLGVKTEIIIDRLKNSSQTKFEAAEGKGRLDACIFEIDKNTSLATDIKIISIREE